MSDFIATVSCNDPKINDHDAVEQIVARYFFDPELNIGVSFDHETGEPYLFVFGYVWPESWKIPEGTEPGEFDPFIEDRYEHGAEEFIQFLKDVAPYLAEPLIVQAVGAQKCLFPLSACEWHVEAGGTEVEINEFCHGHTTQEVAASR